MKIVERFKKVRKSFMLGHIYRCYTDFYGDFHVDQRLVAARH